jgi:hypothetical protein
MSRFDDFKYPILRAIYEDAFRPGSLSPFSIKDLGKVLPSKLIFGITPDIIEDLCKEGNLDRNPPGHYRISPKGIRTVEFTFDDDPSDAVILPAADRVVSLNHNGDPYKEAIKALDHAVAAFKEDSSLGNEWGQEKGVPVRVIEAGRELLSETTARLAMINTTIIEPLRIIRDQYQDAIVAGLVTAAADQVISLIERAASFLRALFGLT